MISKCEKCSRAVSKYAYVLCSGLLCTKVYCRICYSEEFTCCSGCKDSMLCPLCVMIWDICPECLEKDCAKM